MQTRISPSSYLQNEKIGFVDSLTTESAQCRIKECVLLFVCIAQTQLTKHIRRVYVFSQHYCNW